MILVVVLNSFAALLAFAAAFCWFRSAMGEIPIPTTGWGGTMANDHPFLVAFNNSMGLEPVGCGPRLRFGRPYRARGGVTYASFERAGGDDIANSDIV